MAQRAFDGQEGLALEVETLHQVISALKAQLRQRQIQRLSRGEWAPETGFVWADLLNSLERVSAHCADLARWGREEQLSGDDWDSLGQCAARYRLPE
jgi:phosphate:Na+ symporter